MYVFILYMQKDSFIKKFKNFLITIVSWFKLLFENIAKDLSSFYKLDKVQYILLSFIPTILIFGFFISVCLAYFSLIRISILSIFVFGYIYYFCYEQLPILVHRLRGKL